MKRCAGRRRAGRRPRQTVSDGRTVAVDHVDDCKKFIKCLSDHFDGELDEQLEQEFMLHFRTCEKARALVRTFERTIILHRSKSSVRLPADMHERLLAVIRECQESDDK